MTIIQQPSTISLSGNMLPFIINSGSLVNFTLKDGAVVLITSTYEPDATGKITIDIKDIIESRLKYQIKGNAFYEQTEIAKQFTATIDSETVNFKVLRCGVLDLADTPTNWLTDNFLTWQPQNKPITYYSPEWLTYYATQACTIKLKAYFPSEAEQNITLGSCQAGRAFTSNLQYAHIAGLLNTTNEYPTHFDVWTENSAAARLSFIQRYYFSEIKSDQENWFGFENSLGGFDLLRASGDGDLNNDSTHNLAIVDGQVQEYKIDTKRIYTKNTGHLTDYERRWLLDFPSARKKYIYHNGALRQIAVTETNFRYSVSDSPTDYTFKYRFVNQSSCLNLTRSEHLIPLSITVPDIDAPGFFLPPRLAEFPRVTLSEGTLIPAFDPYSDKATTTTVGALVGKAVEETISAVPGHAEGGTLVQVIGEDSVLPATDKNVFSGLRSIKEITNRISNSFDALLDSISSKFLRKDVADTAKELITFEKGLTAEEVAILEEGFKTKDFIPGINIGKGARIDKEGNAELQSAIIRSFLEVPVLKYNNLEFFDEEMAVGGGAVIESLVETETGYSATLKLDEGKFNPFHIDDIIKGIFNQGGTFGTSWGRVVSKVDNTINVIMGADSEVYGGQNYPLKPFMNIVKWGNFTNKERQFVIFMSAKDGNIKMLDGVDNYKAGFVSSQWGKPSGLEFIPNFANLPINKDDALQYIRTLLVQDVIRVDYQGRPIKEIRDRGLWSLAVAQSDEPYRSTVTEQHDVWHNNEQFRCIVDETKLEPSASSQDWLLLFSNKNDIDASNAAAFEAFTKASDAEQKALQAIQDAQDAVADYNAKIEGVQDQLDGKVNNWYYPYKPTLSNYPASEWTTNALKDIHIGDTFTNIEEIPAENAGKSWRFVKDGATYKWTEMSNSDAIKALQKASEAQATADGKSATFFVEPYGYDVGDSWILSTARKVNGIDYKAGELLQSSNKSEIFNQAHWSKRLRYTDDTAVDKLEIGGRNLATHSDMSLWNSVGNDTHGKYYKFASSHVQGINMFPSITFKGNVQYAISFKAIKESGNIPMFTINYTDGSLDEIRYNSTSITYHSLVSAKDKTISRISHSRNTDGANRVYEFQITRGNKILDWSLAPEDVEASIAAAKKAGTDAQSAADTAQTKANSASGAVTSLGETMVGAFKDGVIDDAEKKAIAESIRIVDEALVSVEGTFDIIKDSKYLTTAQKTALGTAKTTLWGKKISITNAITAIVNSKTVPIPTQLKTNLDTAFSQFSLSMKAFQVAIETANGQIQDELKRLADAKVDELEIGGRNLLRGTSDVWKEVQTTSGTYIDNFFKATVLEPNQTYIFSWEAEFVSGTMPPSNQVSVGSGTTTYQKDIRYAPQGSLFGKQRLSFTPTTAELTTHKSFAFRWYNNNSIFKFKYRKLQLEKGVKATDWTPSPEDIDAQFNATIAKVDVEYALHTSATVAPVEASPLWKTLADPWTANKFMWSRIKTTLKDGTVKISNTTCIQGASGKGIKSIIEQYYHSTNATSLAGGSWIDSTAPAPVANKYIWARSKITYTDDTTTTTDAVRQTGDAGVKGEDSINVIVTRQGSFNTSHEYIDAQGNILLTPKKVKEIIGGVNGNVQCKAIIYKGSVDVTESARTKGGNFKWFVNGTDMNNATATLNIPISYADGKDDDVVFQYDDANAKNW